MKLDTWKAKKSINDTLAKLNAIKLDYWFCIPISDLKILDFVQVVNLLSNSESLYMCHFWYLWCPGRTGLSRGAVVQFTQQHPLKSFTQSVQHLKLRWIKELIWQRYLISLPKTSTQHKKSPMSKIKMEKCVLMGWKRRHSWEQNGKTSYYPRKNFN